MTATIQTQKISCGGGLDLRSTTQDLLSMPGVAIKSVNFEESTKGGYRRINGFRETGSATVPGSGKIKGIYLYENGIVVSKDTGIYHSFDGDSWVQVNKDLSTLGSFTDLNNATELPRNGSNQYTFDTFTNGTSSDRTDLLIHDDSNVPAVLTIIGNSHVSAQYRYKEITAGGITRGEYGIVHDDQHIIAGDSTAPSTFYVSAIADMEDFTGSLSGAYSVADPILGISSFRDTLYIFCENSIWKADDLNSGTPNIQPVTRNVGCVSHHTIQEVGGDLLFLATDGLRTLGATSRIDDIELGTVSRNITSLIQNILDLRNLYTFNSTVIREKNQYRLFYTNETKVSEPQKGIVATYTSGPNGNLWSFGELEGINVTAINSGFVNNRETHVHGDVTGNTFYHDTGRDFDGATIDCMLQMPYIDLGDPGVRKNFRNLTMYTIPEGNLTLKIQVLFDHDIPYVHQPLFLEMTPVQEPATYGTAVYGYSVYGAQALPTERMYTEGSGKTISLKFTTSEDSAPFTIQGYNLDFTVSGRI